MSKYNCDILIKQLRVQKNMTQKELAEGICTSDTISRIERGERLPDWFTFEQIMLKLGEEPHRYYKSIITAFDKYLIDTQDKISKMILKREFIEAKNMLDAFETESSTKGNIPSSIRAFILISRAACSIELDDDPLIAYNLAMESIKITIPVFDENDIDSYILTPTEMLAINTLAIIHHKLTGIEKTTEIFLKLKNNYDKYYLDNEVRVDDYLVLLSNLTRNLRYLKQYDKSIDICEQGIAYCKKHFDSYFLPKFWANKSCNLFLMGQRDEATMLIKRACHLYLGLERYDEFLNIKKYFFDNFEAVIDIHADDTSSTIS